MSEITYEMDVYLGGNGRIYCAEQSVADGISWASGVEHDITEKVYCALAEFYKEKNNVEAKGAPINVRVEADKITLFLSIRGGQD